MNKTLKNIGLLAILPLVMVAIAPNFIGEADARGAQDIPFDPVSKAAPGHQQNSRERESQFLMSDGSWG